MAKLSSSVPQPFDLAQDQLGSSARDWLVGMCGFGLLWVAGREVDSLTKRRGLEAERLSCSVLSLLLWALFLLTMPTSQEATRSCSAVMNQLWKGANFKPSAWWLWVLCGTDPELRESPVPLTAVGSCAPHRPWADL